MIGDEGPKEEQVNQIPNTLKDLHPSSKVPTFLSNCKSHIKEKIATQ